MCDALAPYADHFFTSRSWRLGDRASDSSIGWAQIADEAATGAGALVRLHQVHAADAVTYRSNDGPGSVTARADIALTDDPSLALAIQTANCLPILLVDRTRRAVAAAHAGWRGLALRVPLVVVDRLRGDFGCRPGDLIAAIGPAIGSCCYEVGADVRAAFVAARFENVEIARWFQDTPSARSANPPMRSLASRRRPDHWFFDGWACARAQLESAGVPRAQIFGADLCTASHEPYFCSYRRDGSVAGRMAAVVRSKK